MKKYTFVFYFSLYLNKYKKSGGKNEAQLSEDELG
jgi:hypothetical protein